MIYVTVSNVFCIIGYFSPWFLIQLGWLVSWGYLRFYKRSTDALSGISTFGDRSETFAFVQWFPPIVQYVLRLPGRRVNLTLTRLTLANLFRRSLRRRITLLSSCTSFDRSPYRQTISSMGSIRRCL